MISRISEKDPDPGVLRMILSIQSQKSQKLSPSLRYLHLNMSPILFQHPVYTKISSMSDHGPDSHLPEIKA